jgi:hypothetical protein
MQPAFPEGLKGVLIAWTSVRSSWGTPPVERRLTRIEPGPMATSIEFQSCRLATIGGSEEACLVFADGILMALLVRLDGEATSKPGWFLQMGFGPCDQEGLVFETWQAAAAWVEQQLTANRTTRGVRGRS